MLELLVDPRSSTTPSTQLVERVLVALATGLLGPGDKLPSVRVAAVEARVNPNTVSKAWRELEGLGATEGRNGSGVYVTPDGPAIARAHRLEATRAALLLAATAARRAGHDADAIVATAHEGARACTTTPNTAPQSSTDSGAPSKGPSRGKTDA